MRSRRGGEVAEQRRQRDAAGAGAEEVDVARAGDLPGRVDGLLERLDVRIESALGLVACRVAPAHDECRQAAVERPLDDAAPGREIEHVILVDLRRHDHERPRVHFGRRRRVLDQLEQLVAKDNRARCRRYVPADGERTRVDLPGQPRPAREVLDEVRQAADDARALRVDELSQRRRIAREEIGRRDRVLEQRDDEARALRGRRVHLRFVDAAVERCAQRDVRLQQPPEHGALRPGGVGEAAVARKRSERRAAGDNARAVGEEPRVLPRQHPRLADECRASVVAVARTSLRRIPISGFAASVCCAACSASAFPAGLRRAPEAGAVRFGLLVRREAVCTVAMVVRLARIVMPPARPSAWRASRRSARASPRRRSRSCCAA